MANESEQLVRQVTEQVLAAIGKTVVAAPIHPPAGVCTGDYSKFEELRSKRAATVRERATSDGHGQRPLPDGRGSSGEPLRGIITARHLEGRGKTVRLTPCAKLTPLAADYVRSNGISIERGASSFKPGSAAHDLPWVWWCDGREPSVERVTGQLRSQLKPLAADRDLAQVIKKIARRVKSGQAVGGILFVDTAARAACYANRCPSLRAVVGTCSGAVEQGVTLLGANVLIIEHPYHGWKSMRDMIDRFIGSTRPALAEVDRQLKELASCD